MSRAETCLASTSVANVEQMQLRHTTHLALSRMSEADGRGWREDMSAGNGTMDAGYQEVG